MQKNIDGATFRKMIIAANNYLDSNQKYIDSLNVYPVPDGDTGKNMFLTFKAATTELNNCVNNNMDSLNEAFSKGAVRGARGNSGVILSQMIRGMSAELIKESEITTKIFARAMKNGTALAYKAVTTPREGTMLTVFRVMGEMAEGAAKKHSDFDGFFDVILKEGDAILKQTPEMLPALKAAGVVDAGGLGVLTIFIGLYKGFNNDEDYEFKPDENTKSIETNEMFHVNFADLAEINFAYCTEFFIVALNKKTTLSDIDKLRERLIEVGDKECLIVVGDLTEIKVHVHTNFPYKAMEYAMELGELDQIKIENMIAQNRELKRQQQQANNEQKPMGMVAIASGDGIAAVFGDLGVDEIIAGGQTMNPSADDIVSAIEKVPSNVVFVFPNNKNIILAAEQAKNLTKKMLYVVPTVSIPEGIAGALAYSPDGTAEENFEAMCLARENVKSGAVTHAVRKTHVDGFDLNVGDIIGLNGGKIASKDLLVTDATLKLIEKMMNDDIVNITCFAGSDVSQQDYNDMQKKLSAKYPDCEVTVIPGGQPVYYYLISLE
ncbi:MAG: DAK2 domain-containing protein [Firmicutes bacterium]|nr:DAK2 domain-containing protein [Bacillota bacterium]